ncbi:MAG: histone deacetylase [Deltaproteobacteria bacterium]|jgi:acetoin utilization deacetylase AcuC-like enzyme|nr:histone deacetylase [Deltaproteobacteria bacterium]
MTFQIIIDDLFQQHIGPNLMHPECPGRVLSIVNELLKTNVFHQLQRAPLRQITREELLLVHFPKYLTKIEREFKNTFGYLDPQTYFGKKTGEVAAVAAGSIIDLTTKIYQNNNNIKRGFAVTRPPGHHARPNGAMGFCIYNNLALAAANLCKNGASRVAIIDIDFHHGNGIQDAFYNRSDVFYLSIHQENTYPGTGFLHETGEGEGKGYNLNLPLAPLAGINEFLAVIEQIFKPALFRYQPEIILVAAGFDAHKRDPLGNMQLTREGFQLVFAKLRQLAEELCKGKIMGVLEGGYHLNSTAVCCSDLITSWNSSPYISFKKTPTPNSSTKKIIKKARKLHKL